MKQQSSNAGFTVLEILLSAFIMISIITGAFLTFGTLSEKSDILLSDTELRQRIRYIEELLRRDLERAVPTAEMEWYAERDGVVGPRFNPEPFADFGSDGVPDTAESGYQGDPDPNATGACDGTVGFNPDPRCDNFVPATASVGPAVCPTPCDPPFVKIDWTEGNGQLDPGEWLIDMDGNGHFTGEPFYDQIAFDQNANAGAGWATNYRWDLTPTLYSFASGSAVGGLAYNFPRQVDFIDVDGDGVFSPKDDYLSDGTNLRSDPTPPQDNPLTLLADESYAAIDGTTLMRTVAMAPADPNRAWTYDNITRAFQPLSPFGYIDFPVTSVNFPVPAFSSNGVWDPFEIPVYDYFGGIVNCGDQDTLYLRTFVDIGGQEVPANVYYRLIFQNRNRNYAETFTDSGYTTLGPTGVPIGAPIGVGDGIWTPGEPFVDTNANGRCDPIVDPGERILQRIVLLPGNPRPLVQDLGPTVRFNVEYFDPTVGGYVAPFSDTGIDGLYDAEEGDDVGNSGFFRLATAAGGPNCPDPNGDDFFPGLNEVPLNAGNVNTATTERNGILDYVNSGGVPAGTLSRNPFLQGASPLSVPVPPAVAPQDYPFPSGAGRYPFGAAPNLPPGENQYEGLKRFGYPDSAGIYVLLTSQRAYPFNAREQLPVMMNLDAVALEPLVNAANANFSLLFGMIVTICNPALGPGTPGYCSTPAFLTNSTTPKGRAWYQFQPTDALDGQIYRFSPAAKFDDDGWLRCSGVRDEFAFLKPGDQVFLWAFKIPPQTTTQSAGVETVQVPVPPGYYPLIEKRGNRLRLDLSKVPGGAPSPDRLRNVPAVYRAPYLPPALRIDFAVEGFSPYIPASQGIYYRDLRVWSLMGQGFTTAGSGSQGTPPSIPIRGAVITVQPGQGSGTGSRRANGF